MVELASIFKRKNSRYWWINYRDQYGKIVQKSLRVTYRNDAMKLKRHYEALEKIKHLKGGPLQKDIQFQEWVNEYNKRRINRVARSTHLRENQAIRSLYSVIGKDILNSYDRNDIAVWYDNLLKEGPASTANCLLRHIKVFFNWAVDENYISESPASRIKQVKEASGKVKVLTRDEIRQLLEAALEHWEILIRIALYTGCRSGEICRLIVSDVNLENKNPNLLVRSTQINPTKSKKSRVVPLPESCIPFFRKLVEGRRLDDYLAKNEHGNKWSPSWVSRGFSRLAGKLNIDCTFHDLRRTYGAWLVMNGADLVTVQENLGHSDIKVTITHYTHLVIDHRARQTNKLPDF